MAATYAFQRPGGPKLARNNVSPLPSPLIISPATPPPTPTDISDDLGFEHRVAVRPLRVIIVGAGIAGLTLGTGLAQVGHDVTILEQVNEIAEVGAGIQIAPNAARILRRFGLLEEVLEYANVMEKNSLRRYANDEELGTAPFMPEVEVKYGAPLAVIHRGDLQRILIRAAKSSGCYIVTSQKVIEADTARGAHVQTADGTWYSGDVVFAADGIKSTLRAQIAAAYGITDSAIPTGDAAYRVLIPRETIQHDKEALAMLDQNVGMRYMGPGGHVMAYPVRNNTLYNMVLLHPAQEHISHEAGESWTRKGNKAEMLDFYKDWSPLIRKLLSYVPEGEVLEWTLNSHAPLPRWVEGNIALVGDACHPMLPYVAQGAANAIEDAGTLAAALTCTDDVRLALGVYEAVRKERGERIQASATAVRGSLHLEDGPEQERRDEAIRRSKGGKGDNPDLWADRKWQEYMWGVDVMRETIEEWEALAGKVNLRKEEHENVEFVKLETL
ncbi:hypothetical protein N0V90_003363 [Kalmusia sp. IMI 367209]|nr:hypothetical protein N0V90_003363 [Kalmusia sp. IMI 367209]